MHFKKYILLILVMLFVEVLYGQQLTNQDVVAKIQTEEINDVINIKGTAVNKTQEIRALRYIMYVIKTNLETSNTNRGEQSGRFVLNGYEGKELSTTSINKNSQDKVTILLLIYDSEDKLISKDRLVVLNDDEEVKKAPKKILGSQQENDGISLTGIVSDNTRTKSGRDFYKDFFSTYTLRQINAKQIINIEEKLSLGRNTNIIIKADGQVIHQFPARPGRDFIKQMTTVTIGLLNRHIQNIEKQKQQITQY